jgi:hypothetical protein
MKLTQFTMCAMAAALAFPLVALAEDASYQAMCNEDARAAGLNGEELQSFVAQCVENYMGYTGSSETEHAADVNPEPEQSQDIPAENEAGADGEAVE